MNTLNRKKFIASSVLAGLGIGLSGFSLSPLKKEIPGKRIGIIGLDTSHATAFVKALNEKNVGDLYKGYKFVAAYPKGSNDIPSSVDRIPKYTEEVRLGGVEIVSSIPELLKKVDCVCLETNDGRLHLEQALPVLKAGKPLYIDKPMAASLKDASAIFALSKKYKTPVFSTSSLRYIGGIETALTGKLGKIIGAETYSPSAFEKTHPDLFWYGIHGVEMLFTIMGPGCKSVVRVNTPDTDMVIGTWQDGRIGSFRGTRSGRADYGGMVFGEKANLKLGGFSGYLPLLHQIIDFFETKVSPIAEQETLEIMAFMEAADESKKRGGMAVSMESVFKKAHVINSQQ